MHVQCLKTEKDTFFLSRTLHALAILFNLKFMAVTIELGSHLATCVVSKLQLLLPHVMRVASGLNRTSESLYVLW